MILLYSFIIIFSSIFVTLLSKRKINIFLSVLIIVLFLSPTSKLFGVFNNSGYNMALFRYIELFIIVFVVIQIIVKRKFIFRKLPRYLFIISIYEMAIFKIRSFYYGYPMASMPYNFVIEVVAFLAIVMFMEIAYKKTSHVVFNNTIIFSFLVVMGSSSLLALTNYIGISLFKYIHREFYNVYLFGIEKYQTIYDFAESQERFYAFFPGPNQFAILSSVFLLFFYYNFKLKKISFSILLVSIFFDVFILIATQSRTGLFVFLIPLFFIYSDSVKNNKISTKIIKLFAFVSIVVLLTGFLAMTNDRIAGIFNIVSLGEDNPFINQRVLFWIRLFDATIEEPLTSILGAWNHLYIENEGVHIESGFLSVFAQGGVVSFILFIYAILNFKVFNYVKENPDCDLEWQYFYKMNLSITIVLITAEIFQGNLLNVRMTIFYAILYAFFQQNKEKFKCLKRI